MKRDKENINFYKTQIVEFQNNYKNAVATGEDYLTQCVGYIYYIIIISIDLKNKP